MPVFTRTLNVDSNGNDHMIDLTDRIEDIIASGDIEEGIVTIFIPGSTASVTTIEFEPGLQQDYKNAMERISPADAVYDHDRRWGDGNGRSHVRASVTGPGIVVPVREKAMILGTWQQIVLVDFDVRERKRTVIVQVMGF